MAFTWPDELDEPAALLNQLGSFWSGTYRGNGLVESLCAAVGQSAAQSNDDLFRVLACMSRDKLTTHRTVRWAPLELLDSQVGVVAIPRYGDGTVYGGGASYGTVGDAWQYSWKLPAGCDVAVVCNAIEDAAKVYIKGVDYDVREGAIAFRENPFADATTRIEDVFDDSGTLSDRKAVLWMYAGKYDDDALYRQFGYVFGLRLPSTENAKRYVNAVYDAVVEGTAARHVAAMVSAAVDVPLAAGGETVEAILKDRHGLCVVTDRNAYRFAAGSAPTVAVGDVLTAGQSMTNGLQVFSPNAGVVPNVLAMSLGRGFRGTDYLDDLVFVNKDVPLQVQENVDGFTKVLFEIGGRPADTENYWNAVHAAGVAAGATLAMALDTRENKVGQPTSLALPATVNPLKLLAENYLRGGAYVVSTRPELFGPHALGLSTLRSLRSVVPPQTVAILLTPLAVGAERVIMDGSGSETTPGYSETLESFSAGSIAETITPSAVSETVRFRSIGGQCI